MRHEESVSRSFGPQAEAYLTSTVHAQGEDLAVLAGLVGQAPGAAVLDLGCGAGHATFAVVPVAARVVAYDLTPAMLEVVASTARTRGLENIETRQGSVDQLPFGTGEFDWVISRYSAHHWREVPKAIHEVGRVLKPGGQICVIDVAGGPEPLMDTHLQAVELLRDPSHVRNYTTTEWVEMFREFGGRIDREWRMALEFTAWITRMGTAPERVEAIRALWAGAPAEVRAHYKLQADLSFELDIMMLRGRKSE